MDIRFMSGILGRDAEIKENERGTRWISYTLAVDGKRNSEGEKTVKWFICKQYCYGDGAARLAKYLKKGMRVAVVGTCDEAIGDSGIVRYITVNDVEFLSNPPRADRSDGDEHEHQQRASKAVKTMRDAGFEPDTPF